MVCARLRRVGRVRFRAPAEHRPSVVALVAMLLAGVGGWLLAGAGGEATRRHVVAGGVQLDEIHPVDVPPGERRPGVVVAHGFARSARLMAPIDDTLAARGYVVVQQPVRLPEHVGRDDRPNVVHHKRDQVTLLDTLIADHDPGP